MSNHNPILRHTGRYGRHGRLPERDMDGGWFQCQCDCCQGNCLACDALYIEHAHRRALDADDAFEAGLATSRGAL